MYLQQYFTATEASTANQAWVDITVFLSLFILGWSPQGIFLFGPNTQAFPMIEPWSIMFDGCHQHYRFKGILTVISTIIYIISIVKKVGSQSIYYSNDQEFIHPPYWSYYCLVGFLYTLTHWYWRWPVLWQESRMSGFWWKAIPFG